MSNLLIIANCNLSHCHFLPWYPTGHSIYRSRISEARHRDCTNYFVPFLILGVTPSSATMLANAQAWLFEGHMPRHEESRQSIDNCCLLPQLPEALYGIPGTTMGLASRRDQCCCDGISRSSATCCQVFFMILCDSQLLILKIFRRYVCQAFRSFSRKLSGDISKALAAVHGSSALAHGSCRRARPDPIARSLLELHFSKGQAQQPHKLPVRANSALLLLTSQKI